MKTPQIFSCSCKIFRFAQFIFLLLSLGALTRSLYYFSFGGKNLSLVDAQNLKVLAAIEILFAFFALIIALKSLFDKPLEKLLTTLISTLQFFGFGLFFQLALPFNFLLQGLALLVVFFQLLAALVRTIEVYQDMRPDRILLKKHKNNCSRLVTLFRSFCYFS